MIKIDQLSKEIEKETSLSEVDVHAVLIALQGKIMKHLEEVVRPRTLVELNKAVDALQAIFISVYSEPVALTDFVICEGQEFVLNGRKISFSTRDVVVEEIKVNAQFPEPERRPEDAVRAERHAVVMRALGQFQLRPEERMRLLYMEKPGAPAGLPEHRKFSTFGANMTGGKQ